MSELTEYKTALANTTKAWLDAKINQINQSENAGNFVCVIHGDANTEPFDKLIELIGTSRTIEDNRTSTVSNGPFGGGSGYIKVILK